MLFQTIILEKTIIVGCPWQSGWYMYILCIGLLPCYNEWWFTIPLCSFQPTIERFIQMNRGINCGEDLPTDILTVGTACYLSHCFAFWMCKQNNDGSHLHSIINILLVLFKCWMYPFQTSWLFSLMNFNILNSPKLKVAACQQDLSFTCLILEYLRKTLH